MNDNLDKNILDTLCYYDILNYPLTVFEIWKHLIATKSEEPKNVSLGEVLKRLESAELKRFIDNENGMYFLKGRMSLVNQRIARNKISFLKTKRMRRIVGILRMSPFVRMILVTGRLAMKNAEAKSDWDVLVVLKEKRIWIGRTCVTMLAHLLGKRRHHVKIRNRVCFNYFIATNALEIRNKDLFSANEYFFCFPLFDAGRYFERFQIKNRWIQKYKVNYQLSYKIHQKALRDNRWVKFMRLLLENFLDHEFLERYLEKIETKKIQRNPKTNNRDGLIDIDNNALIFLPNPQGPKVFEKFKNKVSELEM